MIGIGRRDEDEHVPAGAQHASHLHDGEEWVGHVLKHRLGNDKIKRRRFVSAVERLDVDGLLHGTRFEGGG